MQTERRRTIANERVRDNDEERSSAFVAVEVAEEADDLAGLAETHFVGENAALALPPLAADVVPVRERSVRARLDD